MPKEQQKDEAIMGMLDIHKLVLKIKEYLTPKEGWRPIYIAEALMKFEATHGTDKTRALGRFIEWAKENHRESIIPVTLGHDLNGCEDPTMHPRTARY